MKSIVIPIVIGALGTVQRMIGKGAENIGNWKTNRDNPNYNIVEIYQNTEKSPGNLRRFAVSQTPVKDHQLTLV